MTLSPVFRSEQSVRLLEEQGIWERLRPAVRSQARAVQTLHEDLAHVIGEDFISPLKDPSGEALDGDAAGELAFLQEYFFLILFHSLFESIGIDERRLPLYAELNFCIKGTITAADNLFDGQDKQLIPLKTHSGSTYMSILQLMCFDRLARRALTRGVDSGLLDSGSADRVLKDLLDLQAEIGQLEGSEEGGVEEIPDPDAMVEAVHRVRGGALFRLAFIAPRILEPAGLGEKLALAESGIDCLGAAFQIVDDLTDFEFDVGRRSHNLLVSQIRCHGGAEQNQKLDALWQGEPAEPGLVEGLFRPCALAVLGRARDEARKAFETLAEVGFWFPPRLSGEVVNAIVGLDGVARMEKLASDPVAG